MGEGKCGEGAVDREGDWEGSGAGAVAVAGAGAGVGAVAVAGAGARETAVAVAEAIVAEGAGVLIPSDCVGDGGELKKNEFPSL